MSREVAPPPRGFKMRRTGAPPAPGADGCAAGGASGERAVVEVAGEAVRDRARRRRRSRAARPRSRSAGREAAPGGRSSAGLERRPNLDTAQTIDLYCKKR
jgi:hypothetical protein